MGYDVVVVALLMISSSSIIKKKKGNRTRRLQLKMSLFGACVRAERCAGWLVVCPWLGSVVFLLFFVTCVLCSPVSTGSLIIQLPLELPVDYCI